MARRSWKTARASSRISNTVALSTQRRVITTERSRFMSACQCTTSRWCRAVDLEHDDLTVGQIPLSVQ